eukprot:CAMPEP_0197182188 /NCGR_PEP_ID=MMETSP1423-20130617/6235_1 /TAXON_ID=476441 /ORGANISM="Pseudo-nitzschia heimii, Strain UNC1101" /LENGTH=600 /DNA_ID=CAMNT_0042632571 /DNA_START=130 /DNA_END=1929 /DNA_ORIENTATION=+
MATPVSIDSPQTQTHKRTSSEQERELQAKVQHMISLQYQQQRLSNPSSDLTGNGDHGVTAGASATYSSDGRGGEGGTSTLSKRKNMKTNGNLLDLGGVEDERSEDKPLHPSTGDVHKDVPSSKEHLDVGKGTIYFSGDLRGSKYAVGVRDDSGENNNDSTKGNAQQHHVANNHRGEQYKCQLSPHSTTLGSQQQQSLLLHLASQQIHPGYGSVPEQNHEFHYGNPDYQRNDDDDYYYDGDGRGPRGEISGNIFARMCACWYRPIARVLSQDNLHRSFCYGAIDGMLTGSGIASAFWGLGLLSVEAAIELRIAVVLLTVAACVADSLCMAMGHVWTTYIVTSNHALERSYERQLMDEDKANSKAKLVDMLLSRGILKIDAMSLADTLEGYPDLFVSALVGDSLLSSGIQDALLDEPGENEYQQHQHQHSPAYSNPTIDVDGNGGFWGSFGSWKFPMYYNSERDSLGDLEQRHVRVVSRESQKEGVFMMLGFALFAIIPSLLWLFLPSWLLPDPIQRTTRYSHTEYAHIQDGDSVNIPSLIILILSGIIWCLGVWKSRFVDSNWIVFGFESVAVLIMCISSAYGISDILGDYVGLKDHSKNR